jgi:hypothetical protein
MTTETPKPEVAAKPSPRQVGELTVERAALRIGDAVFSLPRPNRHHNVMWWLSVLGIDTAQMHDQGFTLSNGQYASRTLAAKVALRNGQVSKLIAPPNLYSEDLWDGGADMASVAQIQALASGCEGAKQHSSPPQVERDSSRETIKPSDGLELDGLREEIVEAAMQWAVTDLAVDPDAHDRRALVERLIALSRKPDLGGGLERSRDLATDVGSGAPKSATAGEP